MYDFKQLSPADFEDLTRDLLQKLWNVRLESFKTGRDGGVDLRYAAIRDQSIVIQCKHFASSGVTKLLSELEKAELPKVKRLAPNRYVLVTSLPLNPADKDKICVAMHPHIRTTGDVFGANDLNNLIGQYPAIEQQHYKLWMSSSAVLERVLHNAEKVQTEFDIEVFNDRFHATFRRQTFPCAKDSRRTSICDHLGCTRHRQDYARPHAAIRASGSGL